ncbi:MAG: VOC family protein [Candidatus Marinimicrobia bacterium]|nr:VOC family protein [Candidatus Neomarinimicrobiota bacterium]
MKKLISWIEIPATNMERAIRFYNQVFGLDLEILDFCEEKMACFPAGEGAISMSPGLKPSTDGVLVSLNTEDALDEKIARVEIAGGKISIPKTKIQAEDRGFFAVFIDSEGNKLGLYGD